jgi:hypothetical protein
MLWMVGAPVGEAVDEPRVAVVGEDHRAVDGEQRVEQGVGQAVRVLGVGLQAHQVDDVDDAHAQLGQMRPQQRRGRDDLERRNVPGAGQHDVGLPALVGRGPRPDPRAARAVGDCLVHAQVVERRLFAGHHNVDVVT